MPTPPVEYGPARLLWLRVSKFVRLGPSGWRLLARAQMRIREAARLLETRPRGELVRDVTVEVEGALPARAADRARVEEIGLTIDRVARMGFGQPRCLVRSIAFQRLLLEERIPGSRIRIGVRVTGKGFEAHAWVEWGGEVVGDDPDYVRTYEPLPDLPLDSVSWSSGSRASGSAPS